MIHNPIQNVVEVASHDLFAVGDVVEITADCMTKGKRATVAEHYLGKIEVSFSPQWCGWYLPEQMRKISPAKANYANPRVGITTQNHERTRRTRMA